MARSAKATRRNRRRRKKPTKRNPPSPKNTQTPLNLGLNNPHPNKPSNKNQTHKPPVISSKHITRQTTLQPTFDLNPATLDELLDTPPQDLQQIDIARLNLLCASALPTTNNLDIEHAITTLDRWAERVAFELRCPTTYFNTKHEWLLVAATDAVPCNTA